MGLADEEPDFPVYTKLLTRTNVGSGPVWLTQTPLLGVSEAVRRFLHEKSPDRHVTFMTIDDVKHFSDEEKERIIASYPKHEVEARTKGAAPSPTSRPCRRSRASFTPNSCRQISSARRRLSRCSLPGSYTCPSKWLANCPLSIPAK